jgi:hypothetical protein
LKQFSEILAASFFKETKRPIESFEMWLDKSYRFRTLAGLHVGSIMAGAVTGLKPDFSSLEGFSMKTVPNCRLKFMFGLIVDLLINFCLDN